MSRGRLGAVLALALASCSTGPSTSEEAATLVVRDMLRLIPEEAQSVGERRIVRNWGSIGRGRVPEPVIAASGLTPVDTAWRPADTLVLLLNLFEPQGLEADSFDVHAEWLIFDPAQDVWGSDYSYRLRCAPSCELIKRHGPGDIN